MAIPDFQTLLLPLLRLAADEQVHSLGQAIDRLAEQFGLSDAERAELLPSKTQPRFNNRVGWASTYLRKAGLLRSSGRGKFVITDRGREVLRDAPAAIDVKFLASRFPEMSHLRAVPIDEDDATFDFATGTWSMRPGVEARIREKIEGFLPEPAVRRDMLRLFAFVIQNADEERVDAWCVRETPGGIQVRVARQIVCAMRRSRMELSVVGPITDEVRDAIGAEADDDRESRWIEGGLLLRFPVERAGRALELLQDPVNRFIGALVASIRRSPRLDGHVPEAISYIEAVIDRVLPQPSPPSRTADEIVDDAPEDGERPSHEPRVRGRAPIFEHGQRSITSLMEDITRGDIALPDLQRPFVWEDTKVRDLLDSLFLGFPVGTLVLWYTSNDKEARMLGQEAGALRASTLVIDGQQRLTSLYAVMRGAEVIDKDGDTRRITIAFRPRDGRFEVADAAIRNDPEYLPNVTDLFSGARTKPTIRREMMSALSDGGRVVDATYEDAVERNLDRLAAISEYRFPVVEIRKTAAREDGDVTEEDVAEIFVRINNQGTRLGQADFVLTLLSVFHGDLRDRIEESARSMSTPLITVDAQQLLRAACGVAFGRARMAAIYRSIRGIDPVTGDADPENRKRRIELLDKAANECIDMDTWRDFRLRVAHAGFVSPKLVASTNAIVHAYALYVRGRRAGSDRHSLDEAIARWIFGTLLTARYSAASESVFEQDLGRAARLEPATDAVERALDGALSEVLTGDYWTHALVAALETQHARAPAALAFRAAQVVLGARGLFSDQLLRDLFEPQLQGAGAEQYRLFPLPWLQARGIRAGRDVNQVANRADLGAYDDMVRAKGPMDYVPRIREKLHLDDDEWGRRCAEHALPLGWESMSYEVFLRERRKRMAELIRTAFRKLGGEQDAPPLTPPWFLPGAEVVWRRIAETERGLRAVVRDVYAARHGERAAQAIEAVLSDPERERLFRALRSRPAGADALSVVDYLYLGQMTRLLFAPGIWEHARHRFGGDKEARSRLDRALSDIAPVRNEIAHVREVQPQRLQRASLACDDIAEMLRRGQTSPPTR